MVHASVHHVPGKIPFQNQSAVFQWNFKTLRFGKREIPAFLVQNLPEAERLAVPFQRTPLCQLRIHRNEQSQLPGRNGGPGLQKTVEADRVFPDGTHCFLQLKSALKNRETSFHSQGCVFYFLQFAVPDGFPLPGEILPVFPIMDDGECGVLSNPDYAVFSHLERCRESTDSEGACRQKKCKNGFHIQSPPSFPSLPPPQKYCSGVVLPRLLGIAECRFVSA